MFEVGPGYGAKDMLNGEKTFTLSSEQMLGDVYKSQLRRTASVNVVIENIVP